MTDAEDWRAPQNKPSILMPSPELAKVRLLCCDVDGVMTDGRLYYDANGVNMVQFHVLDGLGLKKLMAGGVAVCMISQSRTPIIARRAKELGIDNCFTGVDDKLSTIVALAGDLDIPFSAIAHIADDENDLPLLNAVGVPVTVPNGVTSVQNIAKFVTTTRGGKGAVRELCDAILASK